jgi:hypothetical protein
MHLVDGGYYPSILGMRKMNGWGYEEYRLPRSAHHDARKTFIQGRVLLYLPLSLESAEEKTRTSTPFRAHEPESCASTNSATSATFN